MSLLVDTRRVVISQGSIPIYKRVIAAALFTGLVYCLIQIGIGIYTDYVNVMYVYGAGFFLFYGFIFARSRNFVFDFRRYRFREEIQVGLLKFGWWEPLPDLKYVSVYRKAEDIYIIKIFISVNDGFEIGGFDNVEVGIKAAQKIAKKLSIDCWDGTNPGNSDWIEVD